MTYKNCKTLITAGRYEYENMYSLLDLFAMVERITQEEYIELTGLLAQPEEPVEEANKRRTQRRK